MKSKYQISKSKNCLRYAPTYKGFRKEFYAHTDKEMDAKVSAWKAEIDDGSYGIPTFKEIAESYWKEKETEISINSVHGYDVAVRRSIEEFGEDRINHISGQMIYSYLSEFKAKGYSTKTISNMKSVLKGIFDYAFIHKYIDQNPCTVIPQIKGKAKVPRKPADDNDIAIIEATKNESLVSKYFYFCLFTGARRGEAAALQQKDIDLINKTARVTKTLAYGNNSKPVIKDSPKTDAGIRLLALSENVIEILPQYKDPETYIFYPDGFPTRRGVENQLNKYKNDHGIKATLHQLRHNYASMLHSAHIDIKDAQNLLGHANITTTQDIYTHIEKDHAIYVLNTLNEYIKNKNN